MGEGKKSVVRKEVEVSSAGIEIHTGDSDFVLWGRDSNELRKVVELYLKNFVKKIERRGTG